MENNKGAAIIKSVFKNVVTIGIAYLGIIAEPQNTAAQELKYAPKVYAITSPQKRLSQYHFVAQKSPFWSQYFSRAAGGGRLPTIYSAGSAGLISPCAAGHKSPLNPQLSAPSRALAFCNSMKDRGLAFCSAIAHKAGRAAGKIMSSRAGRVGVLVGLWGGLTLTAQCLQKVLPGWAMYGAGGVIFSLASAALDPLVFGPLSKWRALVWNQQTPDKRLSDASPLEAKLRREAEHLYPLMLGQWPATALGGRSLLLNAYGQSVNDFMIRAREELIAASAQKQIYGVDPLVLASSDIANIVHTRRSFFELPLGCSSDVRIANYLSSPCRLHPEQLERLKNLVYSTLSTIEPLHQADQKTHQCVDFYLQSLQAHR